MIFVVAYPLSISYTIPILHRDTLINEIHRFLSGPFSKSSSEAHFDT